jgi:hypothetical protein
MSRKDELTWLIDRWLLDCGLRESVVDNAAEFLAESILEWIERNPK